MDDRRHFGRYSAVLLIALVAICLLAMGALVLLRPRRFTSHQEEIGYMLQQRGIAYEQVRLSQNWRDTQNFYAYPEYAIYGADVTINLPDGRVVQGRIGCRVKRSSCYVSLGKIGITNQALPDLVSDDREAWLDWIERNLLRFALPDGKR